MTHCRSTPVNLLVSPGSIPITTSGKIRRSSCVELYRHGEFQRLDIAV